MVLSSATSSRMRFVVAALGLGGEQFQQMPAKAASAECIPDRDIDDVHVGASAHGEDGTCRPRNAWCERDDASATFIQYARDIPGLPAARPAVGMGRKKQCRDCVGVVQRSLL